MQKIRKILRACLEKRLKRVKIHLFGKGPFSKDVRLTPEKGGSAESGSSIVIWVWFYRFIRPQGGEGPRNSGFSRTFFVNGLKLNPLQVILGTRLFCQPLYWFQLKSKQKYKKLYLTYQKVKLNEIMLKAKIKKAYLSRECRPRPCSEKKELLCQIRVSLWCYQCR